MEKPKKVRIICTNCLYSKILDKISSDPKQTRVVVTDSCPECCADALDGIRYFNSSMDELIK